MAEYPYPELHIYGQEAHHDAVHIVGNRAGLMALVYTLLDALLSRTPPPRDFWPGDGEGYGVQVKLVESLDAYALPYTSDWARDLRAETSPDWPRIVRQREGDDKEEGRGHEG